MSLFLDPARRVRLDVICNSQPLKGGRRSDQQDFVFNLPEGADAAQLVITNFTHGRVQVEARFDRIKVWVLAPKGVSEPFPLTLPARLVVKAWEMHRGGRLPIGERSIAVKPMAERDERPRRVAVDEEFVAESLAIALARKAHASEPYRTF